MYNKNFLELCYACRIGDVENADRLISTGVNINTVDEFDNSPLFLASLCGHKEMVQLLLERGAICDRDRYEGARCIYGALTDSIRDILLAYDVSKAVDVNQPFATHISSLFKDENVVVDTKDIEFTSEGWPTPIRANRFLLFARSEYLSRRLKNEWVDDDEVIVADGMSRDVFEVLMKYIYLIPVLHEINPNNYNALIDNARIFDLPILASFLEKVKHMTDPTEKSTLMTKYQYKFTEAARKKLRIFVQAHILAKCETVNTESEDIENLYDIMLQVSNGQTRRTYPCHLVMLMRAEYFKKMFTDSFQERLIYEQRGKGKGSILVTTLPNCQFETVELLIRYLYYDNSDISWENAVEVLRLADYLLEDRLKAMAATTIIQSEEFLQHYSIFDVLYIGWETRMEKLEQYAAKIIAQDISQYAADTELKLSLIHI